MNSNFDVTPNREKETSEVINEVLANLIHSQNLRKTLVSTTEYILWLENFTILHNAFTDDTWLYKPDELSKEDSEQVDKLYDFFYSITEYANRNFLPIYTDNFDMYTFIKFNNIGYQIGIMSGQGSFAYCYRVDISSEYVFIDFNDIMNNKKQKKVDYICSKLDSISNIIEELIKLGVPEDTIRMRIEKELQK